MPVQLGPTPEPGLGRELFASGGSGPASLLLLLHHPSPEDPTGAPALLACAPRAGPAGDSPGVKYLNKANRNAKKKRLISALVAPSTSEHRCPHAAGAGQRDNGQQRGRRPHATRFGQPHTKGRDQRHRQRGWCLRHQGLCHATIAPRQTLASITSRKITRPW